MRSPLFLTRSDRRAFIALTIICLIAPAAIMLFGTDNAATPVSKAGKDSIQREARQETTYAASGHSTGKKAHVTSFDPNTVDSATLVQIGIAPWKVHAFMNYRSAGARFSEPHDIARCHSFSDRDIDMLLPLIKISSRYKQKDEFTRTKYPVQNYSAHENHTYTDAPQAHRQPSGSNKFTTLTKVDLNTADTATLRRIPGVGEAISSMIVNLRDRLGGFTSVSQLSQIHQITPELYEWFVLADTVPFRQIELNKASFKTLVSHPYISREQANDILKYIRLYGPVSDMEALSATDIFTAAELEKLKPYLKFRL